MQSCSFVIKRSYVIKKKNIKNVSKKSKKLDHINFKKTQAASIDALYKNTKPYFFVPTFIVIIGPDACPKKYISNLSVGACGCKI